jgi:cysteate synthase
MGSATRRHYVVVCPLCGGRQEDDGLSLACPEPHGPALLQTEYEQPSLGPSPGRDGIFRYRDWLPVVRDVPGSGRTVVFRDERLGRLLGLSNLWVAFNGYWPERGADLETATFKALEAYAVLGRLPAHPPVLVVASAGNTAAAFGAIASRQRVPCLLVVPGRGLGRIRLRQPLDPSVRLVVLDGADYADAIALADTVARWPLFAAEGGVRNVGRRDGLATVLYAAHEEMGRLPDHYFQAVGSGAGAIAVHEAARRIARGTGEALPRLTLCQNAPFTPIADAWRAGGVPVHRPAEDARRAIAQVCADELANRRPPYSVPGGVHDALTQSAGTVMVAANAAVRAALETFREVHSIDVEPAAGVALACLRDAVSSGRVEREATVLLNVTGGGRARLASEHELIQPEPHVRFGPDQVASGHALAEIVSHAGLRGCAGVAVPGR